MTGDEIAVHEIAKVANLFYIPSYQRGYRWAAEEVRALLDDLLSFCDESDDIYCLQPFVLERRNDGKVFVVDGQQRLTTIAIILRTLGVAPNWDIIYTAEQNKKLSDLLDCPGRAINDYFRSGACATVKDWSEKPGRCNDLKCLLTGDKDGKRVIFLQHEIAANEDGRNAFQRLNAGKTPLTSSELIRALFIEAGNGLTEGEKSDIAKEWDLIESATSDGQFWSIWNNEDFRDVPTRMDFLFSIVGKVDPRRARHDGLLVYRAIEKLVLEKSPAEAGKDKSCGLRLVWETVLRCWWWMQSCYSDEETYHLLGWLAQFTDRGTQRLWELWNEDACSRLDNFRQKLRNLVAERFKGLDFGSFRYDEANPTELRGLFVLLNSLEAQRRHSRFRFDMYQGGCWDIEHIASQTDNPLKDATDRREWMVLAVNEMSEGEQHELDGCATFDDRWKKVWDMFPGGKDPDFDKHGMGNLVLLDSHTNRAYKNAIFPAKRRRILRKLLEDEGYVPPATEAAFSKSYSSAAAQMRYWSRKDADAYREGMKELFDGFMKKAEGGVR